MPCKLYKKWKDLLTEYTTAEYEAIQTGTSVCGCVCMASVWVDLSCAVADEPILTLKRSVFLTLKEERKVCACGRVCVCACVPPHGPCTFHIHSIQIKDVKVIHLLYKEVRPLAHLFPYLAVMVL